VSVVSTTSVVVKRLAIDHQGCGGMGETAFHGMQCQFLGQQVRILLGSVVTTTLADEFMSTKLDPF
jgi:hypothetical protein